MSDEQEQGGDDQGGGADVISLLYIFGGIPAMVAFFVFLFVLVHLFDIPA